MWHSAETVWGGGGHIGVVGVGRELTGAVSWWGGVCMVVVLVVIVGAVGSQVALGRWCGGCL